MAFRENPVINSPFETPAQHYVLDRDGQPTPVRETGRRPSIQIVPVASAVGVRIRIKGVDIFDPTTGEVRSSQDPADDIACWFIDDDYDDESFFVRQAYFLGRDPYESLKRSLKAEIDLEAWSELNSTVSRAFPKPSTGRVCVKVINHFGDEVQKVFQVS